MEEEWREIEGWPDYLVSNLGRVWSNKRNRPLKTDGKPYKYTRVTLTGPNGYRVYPVHRLVALAFVDGYFDGAMVNHIDGVTNNNVASNLEWVTHVQNIAHAKETGLLANRQPSLRTWTEEEWAELHP
jgi:hypothetical protein